MTALAFHLAVVVFYLNGLASAARDFAVTLPSGVKNLPLLGFSYSR